MENNLNQLLNIYDEFDLSESFDTYKMFEMMKSLEHLDKDLHIRVDEEYSMRQPNLEPTIKSKPPYYILAAIIISNCVNPDCFELDEWIGWIFTHRKSLKKHLKMHPNYGLYEINQFPTGNYREFIITHNSRAQDGYVRIL